jgi:hypothetical protein
VFKGENMKLFLSILLLSLATWACPEFPVKFNVPGTSFADLVFQPSADDQGPQVKFAEQKLLFNLNKKAWCLKSQDGKDDCSFTEQEIKFSDKSTAVLKVNREQNFVEFLQPSKSLKGNANPILARKLRLSYELDKTEAGAKVKMYFQILEKGESKGKLEYSKSYVYDQDKNLRLLRLRNLSPKNPETTLALVGNDILAGGCSAANVQPLSGPSPTSSAPSQPVR